MLKEIDALKNQIKVQNSLFLKTSKELEDKCNTTMNEAIKIHEKSLKDTFDESLDKLKEELKKKETKDLVEAEQIEEKTNHVQTKAKTNLSKAKIKEIKEQNIIKGFVKDCETFSELKINCGLDIQSQR